ncbi:MAG TPA: choice-of-anchor D domain-containing protein, partial [Gammaproteobacteria bacterium]|nr:choice-of-anchor D domain-containing protein [Gammaproteobacteria bacterium]
MLISEVGIEMHMLPFARFQYAALFITFLFLAACGGGSSNSENTSQTGSGDGTNQLFIAGGGIKGPLAFATVALYAADTRLDPLYDPALPLASATTNAYAQITGLAVPSDVPPPYILVIDGSSAIDLNTGIAPVLNKLVTVITTEALHARQPIFATPYTTLAYHMLRASGMGSTQQSISNSAVSPPRLEAGALTNFSNVSIESAGFGMSAAIDVFMTPPILTRATTTIADQQRVVQYRAAIEAFSTLLNDIHLSVGATSDELLEQMGFDLYDDGMLNTILSVWDIAGLLAQDPMTLQIANTRYQVKDIVSLMKEERALVGSSSNSGFLRENVAFNLQPIRAEYATGGTKRGANIIALSTTSIQFGNQDVGSVAGPKPVKLTNTGNAPLTISSISISTTPGFSQTNDCNNYLPVNSTCTFSISFTPISGGTVTGA